MREFCGTQYEGAEVIPKAALSRHRPKVHLRPGKVVRHQLTALDAYALAFDIDSQQKDILDL